MTPLSKGDELGGWNAKKYKVESVLNHGSYGTVYAARNSRTLQKVAIKQVAKEVHTVNNQTELAILTRSRKAASRNIVKLLDSFSDSHSHYIVLEFCSLGDLYEIIAASKVPTDADTVRDLILQLVSAIEACHSVGIYHRDIKPENIFLSIEEGKSTKNGDGIVVVKLGDFGLATWEDMSTEIGTGSDRYMAPEQFSGDETGGYSPAACDIWSLGIVILNILYSRNPWKTPSEQDQIFADFRRSPMSLFDHFADLTSDTFNVLQHALAFDPRRRSLTYMREAIMKVTNWSRLDEPSAFGSRTSTNLAEYDTAGPTAGRVPLRTPSTVDVKPPKAASVAVKRASLRAFQWRNALDHMVEERDEDHRNGLGFARPEQNNSSALSWRIASPNDLDGFDSGLGNSLASSAVYKRSTAAAAAAAAANAAVNASTAAGFGQKGRRIRCASDATSNKVIPASAPARRPPPMHFPPPSHGDRQHLKFGTSWADLDDEEDDLDGAYDSGNEASPSTTSCAHSASSVIAEEDGELFAFEDASPRATAAHV
ncbi:cAMP-dependent protein kinase catalytic subunit [Savitreella phatthalungensis]